MTQNLINDGEKVTCTDCGRWEYLSKGGHVRHSTRCDFPTSQISTETVEVSTKINNRLRSGDGLTSDELLESVHKGHLTMGQAMNTDF